MMGLR